MNRPIQDDSWLWVAVQNPGQDEQYMGQHDTQKDVSFIPAFLEKEDAEKVMMLLIKDHNIAYEIQAVQYADLAQDAGKNGFVIHILSSTGELLQVRDPR